MEPTSIWVPAQVHITHTYLPIARYESLLAREKDAGQWTGAVPAESRTRDCTAEQKAITGQSRSEYDAALQEMETATIDKESITKC